MLEKSDQDFKSSKLPQRIFPTAYTATGVSAKESVCAE